MSQSLTDPQAVPERTDTVRLTPEQIRRRRARSVAIGVALAALVVLFYVATLVKMGAGFIGRPV